MNATMTDTSVRPPSALLALTEIPRAIAEFSSLGVAAPLLGLAPRGDGHPVMVLPGFVTSDMSTTVLRRYLSGLGYDAHTWDLGRNLGPRAIGLQGEKLVARLRAIHETTGKKVSLIGWSLGGVMARQLSRRAPEAVRQVISLGSPFTGTPKATNVWRAYEVLTGQKIDDADVRNQMRESADAPRCPRPRSIPARTAWSRGRTASNPAVPKPTISRCMAAIAGSA